VNGNTFVGGVVGCNDDYATIRNCSALNVMITISGGTDAKIGRVTCFVFSAFAISNNNYARVDMAVRYNWNGSTGTNKTINVGLTTDDGANITAAQWNNSNWWQTTANWTSDGVWDFTNTWEMNANNLPKLKNAGGIQDHFVLTGDGSETNPFLVYDVDTLKQVGSGTGGWGLNKYYRQVQDITLALPAVGQSNWTAIGTSTGQFTGSFDGNGCTISNLTVNRTTAYQGIFGYIGTGGMVRNLGLVNSNISGGNYSGSVAGYNNGTIQNCYVTGSINGGTYTGGVAGYNNGTMQNCYGTSNVSGSSNVGGVVGQNNSMIQNCYATGSVKGTSGSIGGVVGSGGTVRNCVALNPSVITNGGGTVGRVLGSGSGSNNHARNDMVVKYNWNGFNGTNKSISASLTTADGASITATQWNNSNWWQTTSNWSTASGASVWNFSSTWSINVNNLPRLRNVGGVQNHALVDYVDFLVKIPAGSFIMGSPSSEADRFDDEGPQHSVTLTGFYMGRYTVTQEQYQAVMGTNPSGFKTATAGENAARLPVEQVTWYDAVEFCNKLSQFEGLTSVYTISGRTPASGYPIINATVTANLNNNGYRLPTEAQWEYACRAGTSTAYYNGTIINDNTGWYNANSMDSTHEVGKKPANAWGLHDMHGNVWEWCGDWFGNYSNGTQTNPTGASSGLTRVTRGGSWYSSPQGVRSACRNGDLPSGQFANLGFRVVRP
jgi:formylglycine-generating enzyme required for sulfatase activity